MQLHMPLICVSQWASIDALPQIMRSNWLFKPVCCLLLVSHTCTCMWCSALCQLRPWMLRNGRGWEKYFVASFPGIIHVFNPSFPLAHKQGAGWRGRRSGHQHHPGGDLVCVKILQLLGVVSFVMICKTYIKKLQSSSAMMIC